MDESTRTAEKVTPEHLRKLERIRREVDELIEMVKEKLAARGKAQG